MSTKSDRFSNTVHFQHKHITNPVVSPHNKVMKAIADCSNAIKGLYHTQPSTELRDLQQLLDNTTPTLTDASNPVNIPAVPRVATAAPTEINDITVCITRSKSNAQP